MNGFSFDMDHIAKGFSLNSIGPRMDIHLHGVASLIPSVVHTMIVSSLKFVTMEISAGVRDMETNDEIVGGLIKRSTSSRGSVVLGGT
jgi:hypothetical protein